MGWRAVVTWGVDEMLAGPTSALSVPSVHGTVCPEEPTAQQCMCSELSPLWSPRLRPGPSWHAGNQQQRHVQRFWYTRLFYITVTESGCVGLYRWIWPSRWGHYLVAGCIGCVSGRLWGCQWSMSGSDVWWGGNVRGRTRCWGNTEHLECEQEHLSQCCCWWKNQLYILIHTVYIQYKLMLTFWEPLF